MVERLLGNYARYMVLREVDIRIHGLKERLEQTAHEILSTITIQARTFRVRVHGRGQPKHFSHWVICMPSASVEIKAISMR